LGFGGVASWKETHWKQMGVQEEDKCRRKGGEIQSSVGRKRLFLVAGIDFGDIFSPVAKVTSIRLLLSVAMAFDFEVE